ncbi:IS3 family transposase [Tessaracoccus sp. HDW20]|nr:IS3 family transposase [Tessaracoccus coleopterorum]
MVVQFIDDHRDRFGVEPICRVLTARAVPIAPSGYYAFKKRAPSARAIADAELIVQIERVFWDRKLGRGISGARKIWRLLRREGIIVARCTVERLMREQGLRGVRRGKQFITTRADGASFRPRITCNAASARTGRTSSGSSTSRMCRRGRAWHSPLSSPTCSRGGSWAGGPWTGCRPICPWTRWRWRSGSETGPVKTSRE